MFERFTDRARSVVVLAQEEARLLNHDYIGTEHILLGLIHEGEGIAAKALESLGISLEAVRQQVQEVVGEGELAPSGHVPFTPRAKKVLELSLREAKRLGHKYIGTEHILLGLVREGEGVGAQVLVNLGAGLKGTRQAVVGLLGAHPGELTRPRPGRRAGREQPDEIVDRLDSIAARLAAIEGRLGIEQEPLPHELREYDEQIAVVRADKEAAIEDHDFEKVAALGDMERQLRGRKAAKEEELKRAATRGESRHTDVVAAVEEADRLRGEVGRLQAMLRQHGVDPVEGNP
jgi:ATP-dependent Clp protease ATP-binding subunit ClpA